MEVLKIKSDSEVKSVAGAIAKHFEEGEDKIELQAIGAGAVNQAVKSVIVARTYVASSGIDLYCIPAFTSVSIENEDRTAIKIFVYKR